MPELRPDKPREEFAGLEAGPEPPFPIKLSGPVIKGFGRGSRELGIPTANIPATALSAYPDLTSGVYYGFVSLCLSPSTTQPADNSHLTLSSSASTSSNRTTYPTDKKGNTIQIHPAVLSIGYNPFYANKTRSIEIHILHHFPTHNFYHAPLNLLILGFIRPEYDYKSLESLVDDIKIDCEVARRSLDRDGYRGYALDKGEGDLRAKVKDGGEWGEWLRGFDWVDKMEGGEVERVERRERGEEGVGVEESEGLVESKESGKEGEGKL